MKKNIMVLIIGGLLAGIVINMGEFKPFTTDWYILLTIYVLGLLTGLISEYVKEE